jgi:hypothetical protein
MIPNSNATANTAETFQQVDRGINVGLEISKALLNA